MIGALLASSLEQGFLFAPLGLGVLITFRFFRFPDLTAEGSYPLGGAVVAALLANGAHAVIATLAAAGAGALAGIATALIHTRLRIDAIVAGIIVMTALYSVNLRVMGRPNISLLSVDTAFDLAAGTLRRAGLALSDRAAATVMAVCVAVTLGLVLAWFMRTDLGLAVRATGQNETMVRSIGVDTAATKTIGLALSNAAIAFAGALVAQDNGFADIGMGVGILVTGAAAVMLGEAFAGDGSVARWIAATLAGMVLYQFLLAFALRVGFAPTDLKLVTAGLLLASLSLPRLRRRLRWR